MSENKDPAIKLFGKTIPLPESHIPVQAADKFEPETQTRAELEEMDSCKEITEVETWDLSNKSSSLNDIKEDNHKTSSENKEKEDPKPEENQAERDTVCDDKVLKKPDKILPCPRCKSLETKFCYYNNYNVNQPRHFCKNCQRYWTAGGTMRNVPVGAGRRKNKLPSSQYHNILMSSNGIPNVRIENPNSGSNQVPQKENGTVLNFCSEVPLRDSMATVLNLWEKKKNELPENVVQMELGGISGRPSGEWNVPLFGFNGNFNGCSGNGSLTLGKHSREGNSHVEEKQEKCLWIPKTLRIDDPNMASKSSIWDNLSIKPYQDKLVKNGGIFKPFQGKVRRADAVHVLQANPAAFSRFQTFQETT